MPAASLWGYREAFPNAEVEVCAKELTTRHNPKRGSTVVFDSLKHKSPKLQNPACEGREVNMGKHLRKERISHGQAPATHSSVRPRVC